MFYPVTTLLLWSLLESTYVLEWISLMFPSKTGVETTSFECTTVSTLYLGLVYSTDLKVSVPVGSKLPKYPLFTILSQL